MTRISVGTALFLALSLSLVVGGSTVAVWNYQGTQACIDRWADRPDTHVDCRDFLAEFLHYGSLLAIALGLAGTYRVWTTLDRPLPGSGG